jgi:hypothetical protein
MGKAFSAAFAAAVVATCAPAAALAGPYRIAFVLEPTYTWCLSGPSCSSAGRTSFAFEYKPVIDPRLNLRIKLSRAYEKSAEDPPVDDIAIADPQYQTAADTLEFRLRLYDAAGFLRHEPRAGYSYEYPEGTSAAHHTLYFSDGYFFGRGIERGTEGPARQFRVALRLSKDAYEPAGTLPQSFVQGSAYATFPLEAGGAWRTEAGYTLQQQVATQGAPAPFSQRFSASLTHDFSPAARAYLRLEAKLSSGTPQALKPGATSLVLGAKFTF